MHIVDGVGMPGGASGHVNVSLLVSDDSITMVDAGFAGVSQPLVAYLAAIGRPASDIVRIIVTHHHQDHTGGLAEAVAMTGAEVWAHEDDAGYIDGSVARPTPSESQRQALLAGLAPAQREGMIARLRNPMAPQPVAVDLRLVGGEALAVLGGCKILHTPGHTPGHLSLFLPALSLLIAGDLLRSAHGVVTGPPFGYTADPDQALASIGKVLELGFDRLLGYHGEYLGSGAAGASRHILG